MRFLSRGMWGLFLGLLTVGILGLAVSEFVQARQDDETAGGPGRGGGDRLITVSVQKIEPMRETPVISTFGEVTASRELQLRSPESGEVIFLDPNFKSGAIVEAGTLLAQIDPAPLQAARDLSASDLASSIADVEDAKRTVSLAEAELTASIEQLDLRQIAYDRQLSLKERGVGTDAALESAELSLSSAEQSVLAKEQALASAKTTLTRAEASVARNEINLAENDRKLRNTKIQAPFSGVLSDVTISEGVIVSPNERIGTLIDPEALEVSVLLTLNQFSSTLERVGDIRGLQMEVSLTDASKQYTAEILRSDATVADGQTGRRIFAALDPEASAQIRPGDFVRVRIVEPAIEGVTWLPALAVSASNTGLVLGENNVLEERDLTIISRDGDRVLIAARGLRDAYLVRELTPQIGRGITVEPVENGQPLEPEAMIDLSEEQQAQFIEMLNASERMPQAAKENLLKQVKEGALPESTFNRLSARLAQQG